MGPSRSIHEVPEVVGHEEFAPRARLQLERLEALPLGRGDPALDVRVRVVPANGRDVGVERDGVPRAVHMENDQL